MATKNFSTMSTKKLNSLLETASDEDKVKIMEVINKRTSATAAPTAPATAPEPEVGSLKNPDVVVSELTEDEQKMLDAALDASVPAKPTRLTDEERKAIATEARMTVLNHRCEVVPFNSVEWIPGTIVNIIEDKRNNKVLYGIKTDDGRRIIKARNSALVLVRDEVVEPVRANRSNKHRMLDENGEPIAAAELAPWTDEDIESAVKAVIDNVGKTVSYPKVAGLGKIIEGETESGRIVSLVPNKRNRTILYKIEVNATGNEGEKKYAHKTSTNTDLVIADALDEMGQKINESFKKRRYKVVDEKVKPTPEEAFKMAEASYNKALEQLEKAKVTLEKRLAYLNQAKAAYEASLAEAEDTPEATKEPAASAEVDDLA